MKWMWVWEFELASCLLWTTSVTQNRSFMFFWFQCVHLQHWQIGLDDRSRVQGYFWLYREFEASQCMRPWRERGVGGGDEKWGTGGEANWSRRGGKREREFYSEGHLGKVWATLSLVTWGHHNLVRSYYAGKTGHRGLKSAAIPISSFTSQNTYLVSFQSK